MSHAELLAAQPGVYNVWSAYSIVSKQISIQLFICKIACVEHPWIKRRKTKTSEPQAFISNMDGFLSTLLNCCVTIHPAAFVVGVW
jgi:hypothetical protein